MKRSSQMSESRHTWARAFTLIEIVVTISVAAILVGLLSPAVQRAREAARRGACATKLRALGVSLQVYHDTFNCLPLGWTNAKAQDATSLWHSDKSVYFYLLPMLEQANLADEFNIARPVVASENRTTLMRPNGAFACPSDAEASQIETVRGPGSEQFECYGSSYSFCAGRFPAGLHPSALGGKPAPPILIATNDGCFFDLSPIRFKDVHDGLSQTMFMAEQSATLRRRYSTALTGPSVYAPAASWVFCGNSTFIAGVPPVDDQEGSNLGWLRDAASSMHDGRLAVLFGDGSVRWVSKHLSSWPVDEGGRPIGAQTDPTWGVYVRYPASGVWQAIATRSGNETVDNHEL